ncbi:GntR family transcriptional regulator [Monaibacterium marinum]|uniref:GntR family transcriptional regulator n=1 Tax=Pontivivens marinum TaxID=1690039 RepID=A0A2C9CRG3_9RHOB|nr:GntR family transcriptional regulator [Monaibacterium marinum]SOH93944.1 GntR family transcriptional regulator [Monaibacterium marinum]
MPKPLYLQIRETLLARMADGTFRPGQPLPSEFALAKELDVSQGTVRKALDTLANDNLVMRRQGLGTFVPETTTERALFQFFRLTGTNGESLIPEPVSEEISRRPAPKRIAQRLEISTSAPAVRIRRVRALNGVTSTLEDVWLDPKHLPLPADGQPLPNALYTHYQRSYSVSIVRAEDFISAVAAPDHVAEAIGIPVGGPVLLVRRDAFDLSGRLAETRESYFRTDGFGYSVTLR